MLTGIGASIPASLLIPGGGQSCLHNAEEPDIRKKNPDKTLFDAIDRLDVPRVRNALSKNANPNALDEYGKTPILALYSNTLAKRYKVPEAEFFHQVTLPRIIPAIIAITKNLVSYNANVNTQDADGSTALEYCARLGNESLITVLIEHGAFLEITNHKGKRPLDHLTEEKKQNILKWLTEGVQIQEEVQSEH